MKEFVISLLKTNVPLFYYFHTFEHTLYVMEKAIEIGENENCSEHEMELLSAAALWHDTGYIKIYFGHEEESCIMAQRYLPEYGYSPDEINKICGMIMATKIPQSPKNKLEEIIADADLEYLATSKAAFFSEKLYRELHYRNQSLTQEMWNEKQILFLQNHKYFTKYCIKNKTPQKLLYLKQLIEEK
ncbi:MAG: HD domain-containing protein [Fimbriimonadaceae bacterium]|nr:HD domain-containing protein [Chitinophagales bacterium]